MSFDKEGINTDIAKKVGLATDRFPETKQEAEVVEDALAEQLNKLSLEEHEKVIFDVHGLSTEIEETEELIASKLQELDVEIQKIEDKEAYELAKTFNESYVTDRKFRLMFLRCELFDAKAAATKMKLHFKMKQTLFGSGEILGREVRQSDLTGKDKTILESGFAQAMQSRDASGRTVMFIGSSGVLNFPKDGWEKEDECRALWYISMVLLRDEETQKKGNVFLFANYIGYKIPIENFEQTFNAENATPRRLVSGHFCYTDPELRPYVTGFQMFVHEKQRFRFRPHLGSHEEIMFKLQTYGIPTDYIPMAADGTVSTTAHLNWLAMLRREEERRLNLTNSIPDDVNYVIVPRRFDVLFGKQLTAREHTGTLRALHLVEMHFEAYEKAGKYEKTDVAEKIISIVHESEGRFLKEDDEGVWKEVDDVEARKKVAHWFRHARSKRTQKSKTNQEKTTSSAISGATLLGIDAPTKRVSPCESPLDWTDQESTGLDLVSRHDKLPRN